MATRSRHARAAVLASSVQRSKSSPYPSKARSALVRRTVLVVLVVGALALLTISFRSPTAGVLHDMQSAGSSALRPFQIAASRVATPFRDAYDYLDSLGNAKSENARLKKQIEELRSDVIVNATKAREYDNLVKLMHFEQGATYPNGYRAVNARVISFEGGPFAHQVEIDAGTSSGLAINDPVVSSGGLVGKISNVSSDTAVVTLLTDPQSWVAALDLHTGVSGGLHTGSGDSLILDNVSKQLDVTAGDVIVTAGTHNARYPDLYPSGIPIGRVSSVVATDTATFLDVQVQPYADLGSLDALAALVRTTKHR